MDTYLVTGGDPASRDRAASRIVAQLHGPTTRTSATDPDVSDHLADAATPTLTGAARSLIIDEYDKLDDSQIAPVAQNQPAGLTLIAVASRVPRKALKAALGDNVTHLKTTKPTGRGRTQLVQELIAETGVTLDIAGRRTLIERGGHDPARVRSILTSLADANILRPTERQINLLLGTESQPGVPWELTDQIVAGNKAAILDTLDRVEIYPTVAYLSRWLLRLAHIHEEQLDSPHLVKDRCGVGHRYTAERLLDAAGKLPPEAARQLLHQAGRTQQATRTSPSPHHHLTTFALDIARAFHPQQTTAAGSCS